MTNGAVGCSMSHLKILEQAQINNLDHVLIVEDDILFLEPELFKTQLNTFLKLHNNWDVILFAGNNIPPYEKIDDTCVKVNSCQTTTGYLVNGHYINTLFQNIKMGLTHLLNKPTNTLEFAIDRFWFSLQQKHDWYLIIPLSVIQKEDYSDIEKKHTNYKKLMLDLDKPHFLKRTKVQKKINFLF